MAAEDWTLTDVTSMSRALELARFGPKGDANPRVGCVIVGPDGEVLAEGWHRGSGTAHAEADAILRARGAGVSVRGATAYVTLEPCNHQGRTGPCTLALIDSGIAKVIYAMDDPTPRAGGGAERLRKAGLWVDGGLLESESRELNSEWLTVVERGRPWVTWKFATTIDGRGAAADGSSQWITSQAAREDVHERRAQCGAIVVGTGTVLADDPWLTVRAPDGRLVRRQPLRVVVGSTPIPPTARVLDDAAPTLLLQEHSPEQVLAVLNERDIRHVWLEGGPRLGAAFFAAGMVDEVVAYIAPAFLGSGAAAVGDLGIGTIADIARLAITELTMVGPDVRLTARPVPPDAGPVALAPGLAAAAVLGDGLAAPGGLDRLTGGPDRLPGGTLDPSRARPDGSVSGWGGGVS